MSVKQRKFVETLFEVETGLKGTIVKKLGFHSYLMETDEGEQVPFKC